MSFAHGVYPESRQRPLPVVPPSLTPQAGPPVVTLLSDLLLVVVLGLVTDRLTGSEMSLGRSLKGPSVMKKSNKSAAVAPVPSTIINQPSTSADRPSVPPIDFARRRANRELPAEKVIQLLEKEAPGMIRASLEIAWGSAERDFGVCQGGEA